MVKKPPYKVFWQADTITSEMQPDILIEIPGKANLVLDAKWKRPNGHPAEADLRQLYAYAHHYQAHQTFLIYPHTTTESTAAGIFLQPEPQTDSIPCTPTGCSTVFVQLGNRLKEVGTSGLDENGYLLCSIVQELEPWINILKVAET